MTPIARLTRNREAALALAAVGLVAFSAVARADEFRIGSVLPLTGALAAEGHATRNGIAVAAEMFNRAHDKHKVSVVTIDDEGSPQKSIAAVEKLASEKVIAFSGGYGSNIVGPASETAEKLGLVYMTSGAAAKQVVQHGLKGFFRISSSDGYTRALTGFLTDQHVRSLSIVYSTKESTTDLATQLESRMKDKGATVKMRPFDAATMDFKPILMKLKVQDRPEAMVMIGYENDYVGILRAAKIIKPEVRIAVAAWSLATQKMATEFPDLVDHVCGGSTLSYPPQFKDGEAREFADTYHRMFDKYPDFQSVFGYVQAALLFDALSRAADAGHLDRQGIIDALHKTDKVTLIGRVRFDEHGDNADFAQRIAQHQNGKINLVWPVSAATGELFLPARSW